MTSSLRDAAKDTDHPSWGHSKAECQLGRKCPFPSHRPPSPESSFGDDHIYCDRTIAALADPEPPKVERVELGKWMGTDGEYVGATKRTILPGFGWNLYAERPIPAKSREQELAERLEAWARWEPDYVKTWNEQLRTNLREAAKLLRERKP